MATQHKDDKRVFYLYNSGADDIFSDNRPGMLRRWDIDVFARPNIITDTGSLR